MNDQRLPESSHAAAPDNSAGLAGLLDRLHELLQRQLALVRQNQLAAAVALFEETDRCVRHIVDARGLDGRGATEQWQGLERVYRELSLVLTAQRTEVSAALDVTQRGRNMLRIYGNHLSSR